jgi:hypothetical protein
MGRNQEFVCANCGVVTNNPGSRIQCPRVNGGPHSWSAIPISVVHESSSSNHTFEFRWKYAFLGAFFVLCLNLYFIHGTNKKFGEEMFYVIFFSGILSGFFLRILMTIAFGFGIICSIYWLLNVTGFNEKKNR